MKIYYTGTSRTVPLQYGTVQSPSTNPVPHTHGTRQHTLIQQEYTPLTVPVLYTTHNMKKFCSCPSSVALWLIFQALLWTRAPGFSTTRSLAPFVTRSWSSRNNKLFIERRQDKTGAIKVASSLAASQSDPTIVAPPVNGVPPQESTNSVNNEYSNLSTASHNKSSLGIRRIEQFARLPVWPVWHGVLIWLVGRVLGAARAAQLEDAIGGRVCPNFYQYQETSPFIMLVHHCHTFHPLDPLRYFQRAAILPEGFPAHPHRGFITITYILSGGFVHRDSTGVRQEYGADTMRNQDNSGNRYQGKHTQWLVTGSGMLHEEMFDIHSSNIFTPSRQELFQIWLNVPARHKFDDPHSYLLGGDEETPTVVEESYIGDGGASSSSSKTLVLAGTYRNQSSAAPLLSDVALFHVTLSPGASWTYETPTAFGTAFVYVRKGSLTCVDSSSPTTNAATTIPVHHTAYLDTPTGEKGSSSSSVITVTADYGTGADFMFLAGRPLREPCVASGSMVMTSAAEIDEAYRDYQRGLFGQPWDHKLSDEEWQQHVASTKAQLAR